MANPSALPVYHYLSLGRLGRGEVLSLFLKDAGIEFKETRYAFDDTWPTTSKLLQEQGITKTGKLPALEYHGVILTQHIPTLRYLARNLGRYDGETSMEKYAVDAVADMYIDWRVNFQWAANLGNLTDKYKLEFVPKYYDVLAQHYSEHAGPYLLGDSITYADFAVYQSLDNDLRIGALPSAIPAPLVQLREAFEKRPNIKEYLKQERAA